MKFAALNFAYLQGRWFQGLVISEEACLLLEVGVAVHLAAVVLPGHPLPREALEAEAPIQLALRVEVALRNRQRKS